MFVYNLPPINTILLIKVSLFFYGDKMEPIYIQLSDELYGKMENKRKQTRINRSEYIRMLIENDVE